jgi:hypothetical protein
VLTKTCCRAVGLGESGDSSRSGLLRRDAGGDRDLLLGLTSGLLGLIGLVTFIGVGVVGADEVSTYGRANKNNWSPRAGVLASGANALVSLAWPGVAATGLPSAIATSFNPFRRSLFTWPALLQ